MILPAVTNSGPSPRCPKFIIVVMQSHANLCGRFPSVFFETPVMSTIIQAYDIGCEPSPSVSGETVVQNGWATYVLFFAVAKSVGDDGYLKDLGVAVVECEHCSTVKFGYPNDEGRPEHPLYAAGLEACDSPIVEVTGSTWAEEVLQQGRASTQRIWGNRDPRWKPSAGKPSRHFIILLKEKTFECLAGTLVVRFFAKDFAEAFEYVRREISKH